MPAVMLLAGHIGQRLVHELRGIGAAFAHQTRIKPFFGDALQLAKKMQLRFLAGVAPLGEQQPVRQVIQQGGAAQITGVDQREFNTLANDAGIVGNGGPNQIGRQLQHGVFIEFGFQPLLRQFDAVTLNTGEADFQVRRGRGGPP